MTFSLATARTVAAGYKAIMMMWYRILLSLDTVSDNGSLIFHTHLYQKDPHITKGITNLNVWLQKNFLKKGFQYEEAGSFWLLDIAILADAQQLSCTRFGIQT